MFLANSLSALCVDWWKLKVLANIWKKRKPKAIHVLSVSTTKFLLLRNKLRNTLKFRGYCKAIWGLFLVWLPKLLFTPGSWSCKRIIMSNACWNCLEFLICNQFGAVALSGSTDRYINRGLTLCFCWTSTINSRGLCFWWAGIRRTLSGIFPLRSAF